MNIQLSFYWSVNGTERAPRSDLARLPAISSFRTLFVGIHTTKRKSCTGVHESHSTTAVQRLSSVAVCHLVSTPLSISKLISSNAKKVKYMNIILNTVSRSIHTKQRIESVLTNLHNDISFVVYKCKKGVLSKVLPHWEVFFRNLPNYQMLVVSQLCPQCQLST